MFDKVNITAIVRDHVGTFKTYPTNQYRPLDFVLFFLVPLAVATGLVLVYGAFLSSLIGVVATSLSIFTALLLNLLLLAYNITRNSKPPPDEHVRKVRESLFHEIFSNIAFAILVALVTVITVLILGMLYECNWPIVTSILSFVIYYMGTLFLLTLLMLLKRVYVLLIKEQVTPESSQ